MATPRRCSSYSWVTMQFARRVMSLSFVALACAYAGCAKHHLPALGAESPSTDAGVPAWPVPSAEQGAMPDVPVAGFASDLPEVDLRDCFGVSCSAPLADPEAASETQASRCDPRERVPMTVAWKAVEPGLRDCPEVGACRIYEAAIAPTDEGRLWVLAEAHDPDSDVLGLLGVWLALYDSDGRMLHEQMADLAGDDSEGDLNYRLSMAADARGHLFVAVARLMGASSSNSWLAEYGADGERIARRTVEPATRLGPLLAMAGADKLAVGQLEGEGGIAMIGTDGTLRWTQSHVGMAAIGELVSDASARVTIAGPNANYQIIEQYDEHGSRSWSRRFDRLDASVLAVDHRGGVVRAGMPSLLTSLNSQHIEVYKLDSSGTTVWRTDVHVPPTFHVGMPVVDVRGNIAISGRMQVNGSQRAIIHELSGDGAACKAFEVDSASLRSIDRIATSADGHGLFFQATRSLSEHESELLFGRLAY